MGMPVTIARRERIKETKANKIKTLRLFIKVQHKKEKGTQRDEQKFDFFYIHNLNKNAIPCRKKRKLLEIKQH